MRSWALLAAQKSWLLQGYCVRDRPPLWCLPGQSHSKGVWPGTRPESHHLLCFTLYSMIQDCHIICSIVFTKMPIKVCMSKMNMLLPLQWLRDFLFNGCWIFSPPFGLIRFVLFLYILSVLSLYLAMFFYALPLFSLWMYILSILSLNLCWFPNILNIISIDSFMYRVVQWQWNVISIHSSD